LIEKSFLSLTTRGFHRVAYNEWARKDRAQTVICVHGLSRNAHDFDALAQALEQERRVASVDLVGRGRSDWLADKQQYNFATYCADMVALMARLGQETYDWVGTSLGGFIGMFLAAQPNSPIRRLVINDAGAFVPKAAPQRMLEYVGIERSFESLAEAEKYFRVVTVQNLYNLVNRQSEAVLSYCEQRAIGFIPWFPLAAGALAKPGGALAQVAQKSGASPSQVALAWILARSPVMLPIPGTARVKHLDENTAAASVRLSEADFAALDRAATVSA